MTSNPAVTIDNSVNWLFTCQWLLAISALICLGLVAIVVWQIWQETK